jgi:hypothetical protein
MNGIPRILIIEDNSDNKMLILRQLKIPRQKNHIAIIRDGSKALLSYRDQKLRNLAKILEPLGERETKITLPTRF